MISPLSLARHRQMHTEKTGERLTDTEAMSAVRSSLFWATEDGFLDKRVVGGGSRGGGGRVNT